MAATRILAASSPGEIRVAAVDDAGTLLDYAIHRPGAPDGVGDLHRGRVAARAPALAGSFVVLDGAPDGFLPDSEGGKDATEGEAIGVRVTRAAQGGKGPRLTARVDQAAIGAGPPALLRRGPGAVERLAALHRRAGLFTDDPALAATLRATIQRPVWDEGVKDAVAALAAPEVTLPGGGRMIVQPTRALTAIDLDTGATSGGRQGKAAAQRGFNRAALPVLARQIRLRGLAGAILIDFAGLPARRRAALGPDLAAALAVADPGGARLLGFTSLGLAELVRPRIHPPLHELLTGPHASGLAALREAAAEAAANPARAVALRAAPPVVAALEADPAALPALARRTGRPLLLRADPALPHDAWRLETA